MDRDSKSREDPRSFNATTLRLKNAPNSASRQEVETLQRSSFALPTKACQRPTLAEETVSTSFLEEQATVPL